MHLIVIYSPSRYEVYKDILGIHSIIKFNEYTRIYKYIPLYIQKNKYIYIYTRGTPRGIPPTEKCKGGTFALTHPRHIPRPLAAYMPYMAR